MILASLANLMIFCESGDSGESCDYCKSGDSVNLGNLQHFFRIVGIMIL